MAILPVTLYGDKILRNKAKKLKEITPKDLQLIKNMFETMNNAYGIGLAANQVGSDKSIFVVDLSPLEDYKDEKPRIFINPQIIEYSTEKVPHEEGCLSIPDVRAEVLRPKSIKIKFKNISFEDCEIEADEMLSRVIQHEYDHLKGIFFTDKIDPETQKKISPELNKIKKRKIEIDYPVTEKPKEK